MKSLSPYTRNNMYIRLNSMLRFYIRVSYAVGVEINSCESGIVVGIATFRIRLPQPRLADPVQEARQTVPLSHSFICTQAVQMTGKARK